MVVRRNEEEKAQRRTTLALIESWWSAFSKKAPEIARGIKDDNASWELAGWMEETLQAIHPKLMWEYGRAPSLAGWEFYGHRLRESYELAIAAVRARCDEDIAAWRVVPSLADRKVDLTFFSPTCAGPDDEANHAAACVATEEILGEDCLNTWIGVIDVMPSRRRRGLFGFGTKQDSVPAGALPLSELCAHTDRLIAGLIAELPREPYFRHSDGGSGWIYKLQPQEMADYPGVEDMFVGKAAIPGFFGAVRRGYFDSACFSRCGEMFCYVKLDGTDGLAGEGFADKGEIEDALDDRLRDAECGCFTGGGGSGLRYSYVDLALTDLHRGIELIREVLRSGDVPKRSWIMFYDSEMAAEWVGIYPDTPPPPMACSH